MTIFKPPLALEQGRRTSNLLHRRLKRTPVALFLAFGQYPQAICQPLADIIGRGRLVAQLELFSLGVEEPDFGKSATEIYNQVLLACPSLFGAGPASAAPPAQSPGQSARLPR